MQGLGSGAIALFGTEELRERYLPRRRRRRAHRGVRAVGARGRLGRRRARPRRHADGDGYVLNGTKTWISNGGLADFYIVFARTGEKLTAFVLDADAPGLRVAERIEMLAPHPIATLELEDCRVPRRPRLGAEGEGFKVALSTLDVFRPTVGAAALGFARRALDEALARVTSRAAVRRPHGRSAARAGQARRDGARDRRQRAARLPRRLDEGRQRRRASRARRRWPSCTRPRPPSA